jgi:hypothetical protein
VGGEDFPEVLADFRANGLLPWSMPIDGANGDGPAILNYSHPSVINPNPETEGLAPMSEEELKARLEFINAKYFYSVVNPIRD